MVAREVLWADRFVTMLVLRIFTEQFCCEHSTVIAR